MAPQAIEKPRFALGNPPLVQVSQELSQLSAMARRRWAASGFSAACAEVKSKVATVIQLPRKLRLMKAAARCSQPTACRNRQSAEGRRGKPDSVPSLARCASRETAFARFRANGCGCYAAQTRGRTLKGKVPKAIETEACAATD